MRLPPPLLPDPRSPLGRANPVAKLCAAAVLFIALLLSLDGLTAAIVIAGLVAVLPFSGLSLGALVSRAWLVGLAAVSVAIVNVLFAAEQVGPVLELGPLSVGGETILNALGLALRLVAIALAGILATATSDPTELADALIQQLRVSPRFAIGAFAALRLLPMLSADAHTVALARRARGIDAGRSPVALVRLFASRLMGLLVAAIRRAGRMALAMDARGLGARPCRSVARPQRMRGADWAWIGGAVALGTIAVTVSLRLGAWRPLLG